MRVGVYAGSFNPIHNAHIEIANKIINENVVDKVVFVPAGDGYDKKGLIEATRRYDMIKFAIKENYIFCYGFW